MKSLKGQLLLAGADMLDPNFAQTVTLLIEHNAEGTLGLVLNRPTRTTVAAAWQQVCDGPCLHEGMVHQGGPCEGPLMLLHDDAQRSQLHVVADIHFTNDRDHIEYLIEHPASAMRCFVNYAGWAGGQLESELDREAWIIMPATADRVFEGSPELWYELLKQVSPSQAALLRNPELWPKDPSAN